jgi:hypothetical protein
MGLRLRSIRTRIFLLVLLPVLSLIALYGFATFLTARGALNLGQATTIKNATGEPIGAFLSQIDAERPLALVYLSAPTGSNLAVLQVQQNKTTAVTAALSNALNSPDTMNNATPAEKRAIATMLTSVKNLPGLRAQVRSQIISKYRRSSPATWPRGRSPPPTASCSPSWLARAGCSITRRCRPCSRATAPTTCTTSARRRPRP